MPRPRTQETHRARVRQAYLLIARHLDRPLDLVALAEATAFSRYHFHRIYQSMIGETVADTHRRLRLERAAGRLVRTRLTVTVIALDAGYETPQAFSRAFSQQFGVTPSAYRQKQRTRPEFSDKLPHPPVTMESIDMNVTIETRPTTTVYGIRHVGPYMQIGPVFQQLGNWIISHNLMTQAKAGYGIYYDDPSVTPDDQCRAAACVELSGQPPAELGQVERITIEAGRYACYRHIGPYTGLEQAYQTLYGQWLPSSGYECADAPCFEIYVNDPQNTPEDQLITDIYVPLKG